MELALNLLSLKIILFVKGIPIYLVGNILNINVESNMDSFHVHSLCVE
jgi:hypothetical protein